MNKIKALYLISIIIISLFCISAVNASDASLKSDLASDEIQDTFNLNIENEQIEESESNDENKLIVSESDNENMNELSESDENQLSNSNSFALSEDEQINQKANPILTVSPTAQSYKYGDTAILIINLTDEDLNPISGYVITTVDGKQYFSNITTGSCRLSIPDLENNTYPVTAEFLGNDFYNPVSNTEANIIINKSNFVSGEVSVEDIVYGENAIVTINNLSDCDGNKISAFGGYQLVGPVTPYGSFSTRNGKASISIKNLTAGNYSIYIVFGNNRGQSYKFDNFIVNFTVNKATPTINAIANGADFGENSNINISLTGVNNAGLNQNINLVIDNKDIYTISTENGNHIFNIDDLSVGKHFIFLDYEGNENYTGSSLMTILEIKKAKPILDISNATVENGDIAKVSLHLTDRHSNPIRGTVIVKLNGLDEDGEGESNIYDVVELDEKGQGEAKLPIKGLAPGIYNMTAIFIGNEEFETKENDEAKLTILDNSIDIEVTVKKADFGEDVLIKVLITNASGYAIEANAVNITINGVCDEFTFAEDNMINLGIMDSGVNNISLSFNDGIHEPASEDFIIFIEEKISEINATLDFIYDNDAVTVILNDLDGNPIGDANLNIILNGIEANVSTKSDGKISIPVSGNATLKVTFTDERSGNLTAYIKMVENVIIQEVEVPVEVIIEVPVIPNRTATVIDYQNMTTTAVDVDTDGRVGKYFIITLKDSKGNALANKHVQIGFNANVYERYTDENGSAKLQINLKNAGTYTFAVCFLGDDEYNGSFIVAKILVNKQKGSLTVPAKSYKASTASKTLTATFKSASGKGVKAKKITFTVNGKSYSATTNAKGVATVKVSLSKKGTYSFTAKFAGNNMYAAISKTAKLTIS